MQSVWRWDADSAITREAPALSPTALSGDRDGGDLGARCRPGTPGVADGSISPARSSCAQNRAIKHGLLSVHLYEGNLMPPRPREGLTGIASLCFIRKRETRSHSRSPRQAGRRPARHHPDPARLLASSPHPPSHRLCRLRPRPRPLSLGLNRQQVVAQLPETEGHLGAHLRVEPAAPAPGEESMTRIAEPQLSFADLELRNQGVHLDPLLQG